MIATPEKTLVTEKGLQLQVGVGNRDIGNDERGGVSGRDGRDEPESDDEYDGAEVG